MNEFPVSVHLRSIKIQNYKRIIESKLEDIDYAIKIFSLNKVFLS
jgi:hypothetical protein